MLRSCKFYLVPAIATVLALVGVAHAVPMVLSHQGRLLDASDHPLSGTFTLIYSIHDAPVGGAQLWMEDHVGVTVTDGLFTVELGTTVPLSADIVAGSGGGGGGGGGAIRYLQVQISGQPPITPRTPLTASPYSVATQRVSGDIQTAPGVLTATSGPTALVMSVNTADPESQISLTQNGTKRFGVGVQQPESPLGTRMVIGDLDRDGLMDVVVADGASSMTLVDSTSSGGAVVSSSVSSGLGLQPLGGKLIIHAENSSGSSRSSVQCSADSAVGSLSQTTDNVINNMRTRIDALEARLVIETDPSGDSKKNANIAATLNGNVVIGCASHDDPSGVPQTSCEMLSDDSTSSCTISGSKGKYYVIGATHRIAGGSSNLAVVGDDDGDLHSDRSIWQKVDNSEASCAVTADIDDDGVPDVGNEFSAMVTRSVLKSYFQSGDKPTQSQFRVIADSSGAGSTVEVDTDDDDDPDGGCSMEAKETRNTLKTYFETGDIPTQENRVISTADSSGSSSSTACQSETSLSHIECSATPSSAVMELSKDNTTMFMPGGDYHPATRVLALSTDDSAKISVRHYDYSTGTEVQDAVAELSTVGAVVPGGAVITSALRMGRPGVNTALIVVDDDDATLTLDHQSSSVGDRPTAAQFGTLIDSYMNLQDDGVTRCAMTSSTGLTLRDQFGNQRTTISTEGTAYLSDRIGIGKTPVEKIDVEGGAYCDGTNWVNASDKNAKENFQKIDGEELLERISDLEIAKWNYKGDKDAEHIGPTAQDFKKTFGVGADDKSISTIDPSGIALAAIKELYAQLKAKDREMDELRSEVAKLKKEIAGKK